MMLHSRGDAVTGQGRGSLCRVAGGALLLTAFVSLGAFELGAQQRFASSGSAEVAEVTFTRDVAPILQEKCVNCHRAGGGAPTSLETYESASPWAPLIKYRTGLRDRPGAMPPWYVEKNIGIQQFKNDMSLSDDEVATIAAWADAGAPQGDPSDMPPPLEFDDSGEWAIRPDLVVRSEVFFMKGGAPDWWGEIEQIKIPLEEDRYVQAMQVRETNDVPQAGTGRVTVGGGDIVHHLTFMAVSDAERQGFVTHEIGRNEDYFDAKAGRLLPANSELVSNSLHLHSNGGDTRAYLEIAFQLHPEGYEPEYRVRGLHGEVGVPGNTVDMDVPANETTVIHAFAVLDDPTKILSYEPHLHAPGVRSCMEAIWGSKAETLNCVGYDHTWVRTYNYADDYMPLLPAGTILHMTAWMDNTAANPNVTRPENWMGGGNRSVANMFLELGQNIKLTDEQFLEEMKQRVEALDLTKNDYVVGCPLCVSLIPPTMPKPADLMDDIAAGGR
jgi:mono/diheme cytochrome c family protein